MEGQHFKKSKRRKTESGFALLGFIVAVGVVSLFLPTMLSAGHQFSRQYDRLAFQSAQRDIQRLVRSATFCPDTVAAMPAAGCAGNPEVPIFQGDGTAPVLLVAGAAPYSQFGKYEVRARCEDGIVNYRILVDVRRVGSTDWREDVFGSALAFECPIP